MNLRIKARLVALVAVFLVLVFAFVIRMSSTPGEADQEAVLEVEKEGAVTLVEKLQRDIAPKTAGLSDQNDIKGKLLCGYQLWFKPQPGSDFWHHWGEIKPRGITFENYPYIDSNYDESALYDTKLGTMPLTGQVAQLFHSWDPSVIDTHFMWMQKYDIGGAGIQRFYGEVPKNGEKQKYLQYIMQSAEKYKRLFYCMYDFSGAGNDPTVFEETCKEFISSWEDAGLTRSPSYAHAVSPKTGEAKPVVCLWGLTPENPKNYPMGDLAMQLVEWFYNRGYYVIVGTPDNQWRNATGSMKKAYLMADMISPWTVGRYGYGKAGEEIIQYWNRTLDGDIPYAKENKLDYLPVVFPGFAWSNWLNGAPNAHPRHQGDFAWKAASAVTAYKSKTDNISSIYLAMFDEYDEGTAFMKAASDSFQVPQNPPNGDKRQYFYTLSREGQWLSEDFYLRLAADINALLTGGISASEKSPTPYTKGPVFWRNSFEMAEVTWKNVSPEKTTLEPLDIGIDKSIDNPPGILLEITEQQAKTGNYSMECTITPKAAKPASSAVIANCTAQMVPIDEDMTFSYAVWVPENNSSLVFADILLSNGEKLSDYTDALIGDCTPSQWNKVSVGLKGLGIPNNLYAQTFVITCKSAGNDTEVFYFDDLVLQKPRRNP